MAWRREWISAADAMKCVWNCKYWHGEWPQWHKTAFNKMKAKNEQFYWHIGQATQLVLHKNKLFLQHGEYLVFAADERGACDEKSKL